MKYGKDLRKVTPSCPSAKLNEDTHKWVHGVVHAFESKNPDIVAALFEDSDDIKVMIESVPPAEGREAVKALYEWMFKCEEHVVPEWDLRLATTVGDQVMFSLEDADAESKGKTKRDTRVHLIAVQSTIPGQEDKIKTLTLYGDNSKGWVDGYEHRGCGKKPDFKAKSSHRHRH